VTEWVKLHLIVEGETELAFRRDILKPHLAPYRVSVNPFMLPTNRRLGAYGGALSWDRFDHNVSRLLKQYTDKSDRFSTMIDWYKLVPSKRISIRPVSCRSSLCMSLRPYYFATCSPLAACFPGTIEAFQV
jgi:hypothetical protein